MKTLIGMTLILLCSAAQLRSQEDSTLLGSPTGDRDTRSVVFEEQVMGMYDIGEREFLLHHVPEGCTMMAIRLLIQGVDAESIHMMKVTVLCEYISDPASKRFREFGRIARNSRVDPLKQILLRPSPYFVSVSSSRSVRGGFSTDVPVLDALFHTVVLFSYVLLRETAYSNSASLADYSLPPGGPGMIRHSGDIHMAVRDRGDLQALEVHRRVGTETRISP